MSPKVAFGWYTAATYPRFLEVIADRHRFSDDFETWHKIAHRQFDELRARGLDVVKVLIDPDEMAAWCRTKGRAVDSNNRAAYASFVLLSQNDSHTAH